MNQKTNSMKINITKHFLTLGIAALLFSSCSINVLNNLNANMGVTFEVLKQEVYGGREKKATEVVKSQEQLDKLYKELGSADAPKIDFEHNNVVAIFMGQKNTGGYSISIRKISVEDNVTTIAVKYTMPEGMASMALTAPYCIAVIPKTDRVVVVE